MTERRIAFVTDNHFHVHTRFAETIRVHDWIAADAAARGCTGTLLGGDFFETKSTAAERNAGARWLRAMAKFGRVLGVRGNHEVDGDLDIFNLLEAENPIEFLQRPAVVDFDGVAVACLPWPKKAQLLAALESTSYEDGDLAAVEALRAVARGLGEQLARHNGPKIGLLHAQVRGSRMTTGQPLIGAELELGLEDLALLGADFYAMGHIHNSELNVFDVAGKTALFGGSPQRCTYGETERKFYTIITVDRDTVTGWERIETPATPMLHLEGEWTIEDNGVRIEWDETAVSGADVRLRYAVPRDRREAAQAQVRDYVKTMTECGAVTVKVEEMVRPETRARAPEVARATTLRDAMGAHWTSKDFDPGARAEGLLAKLDQLEEEHRAA